MIRRIIEFSAQNRILVIVLAAAAVAYSIYTMQNIRLDAIPDLSDTQVIVYTKWDRSPDIIEDQVTYPIITALLGAPKVKAIRGFSDFGFSLRVRHFPGRHGHLLGAQPRAGISVRRSPAACRRVSSPNSARTQPAWAGCIEYALVDKSGKHNLAELRSYPGLVFALRAAKRAGRGGGGGHRRIPETVPGDY